METLPPGNLPNIVFGLVAGAPACACSASIPGLTRCGLGVVEGMPGGRLTLVAVDVVRTPAADDIGARLLALERGCRGLARRATGPTPSPSSGCSASTTSARSWAPPRPARSPSSCAARAGIPVALHTPSEVKAAVTGNGRADKAQVAAMVTRLLRLDAAPSPADAADALALAICHVWRGGDPGQVRRGTAPRPAEPLGVPLPSRTARDRQRRRPGRCPPPGRCRRRGRRRRAARALHPGDARRAAARRAGPAGHLPGRAGGLADALRLRRRRRAGRASSCCRPPPASARGSPRPPLAVLAPGRAASGPSPPRTSTP